MLWEATSVGDFACLAIATGCADGPGQPLDRYAVSPSPSCRFFENLFSPLLNFISTSPFLISWRPSGATDRFQPYRWKYFLDRIASQGEYGNDYI